jgi:hypothetical protein
LAIAECLTFIAEGIKGIKLTQDPQLKKQESDIGCFSFENDK